MGKKERKEMERERAGFSEKERKKRTQKSGERKLKETKSIVRKPIDLRDMEKGKVMKPGEPSDVSKGIIKAKPKAEMKKTGISKLREEDNIIGKAVRAATDWKTTVALVGTLATIGIGAGVIAGAGARTAVAVGTRQSFAKGGQSIITRTVGGKVTEKFAVGKLASQTLSKSRGFAVNAKSKALTTSLLTKSGMAVGVAAMAGTVVGTYPFANFELAEATDKIGIAMFQAAKAGDVEEVARLQEYLEEMVNPSVWDSVVNKIPFANVLNSVKKNIAAAQVSAKSILQSAEKELEKTRLKEEEPTFAEEREESDIAARERRLEERKEDEKYYEKTRKEAEKRDAEKRLANEKYWSDIYKRHEKKKADERAADEAYWAKIKGASLDDEDKKIIDDWNKGRSALNFKWLGI